MTRGKLGWIAALGALAVGVTGIAEAQFAPQARPLYGYVNLQAGFTPDPHIMRGVIGGTVQARQFNPSCRGIVNPQPSHVIRSRSGFRNIRFVVNGQGDSTLMVMLPSGAIVCDDDGGEGNNPLVQVSSPPGEIRVWVGAYSASHQGQPYTLGVTELAHINANNLGMAGPGPGSMPMPPPVAAINPNARPAFGTVRLRRGFMPDPHVLAGQSGGSIPANTIDPSCRGHISSQPSHVVMSQSGFGRLRVLVNSGQLDTTLVVMAPNGQVFCNDDGGGASGFNPVVELSAGPGPIRIWVGTYSAGQAGPYNIGLTERAHLSTANIPPPGGIVPQPQPMPLPQPIPPPVAQVVEMQTSIPVTLLGPGLQPGTVALWHPRGGAPTHLTMSGRTIMAGGVSIATLPPSMREPVVTVTQQRGDGMIVRMEQPPIGRRDRGQAMIVLVRWRGHPVVQETWTGRFGQRGPRWAR